MDGLEMWDGDGAHLNVQSNTAALFPGLPLTIRKKNTWTFLTTSKRRIHCTALKRERHVDNNHVFLLNFYKFMLLLYPLKQYHSVLLQAMLSYIIKGDENSQ